MGKSIDAITQQNVNHMHNSWYALYIFGFMWIFLPMSFKVASQALGQSYGYNGPSASEVTLKDMGKMNSLRPSDAYICLSDITTIG